MATRVSTATRVRVGTQHQQVVRLVSGCDIVRGGGQFPRSPLRCHRVLVSMSRRSACVV